MTIKIDLEKAFDRLEWIYIRHILLCFNFTPAWIDLIMSCITTSNRSILLNCVRLNPFLPTRDIRQGDLLSPYIFILCMKHLA